MVDLETMGRFPGAALLSIGAVRFDPYDVEAPIDRFHVGIALASNKTLGLEFDPETIAWWMHDDRQPARSSLEALEKVDIHTALFAFAEWCAQAPVTGIWGNAASFDCGLLAAAYRKAMIDVPWEFWQERCYRTVKNLLTVPLPPREGPAHNALADALVQAQHLQQLYRALDLSA